MEVKCSKIFLLYATLFLTFSIKLQGASMMYIVICRRSFFATDTK